ncbi:MAG TPA: hypothetical protein VKH46_12140 [Thermoanaerobaculia bacterium]|nr:hypothetical protein [Thermoanaerobaculia bacterium]
MKDAVGVVLSLPWARKSNVNDTVEVAERFVSHTVVSHWLAPLPGVRPTEGRKTSVEGKPAKPVTAASDKTTAKVAIFILSS